MRIANLEGVRVPPMEMPGLEMSDAEGYVYADPTATGVFLFEENWLRGGVGTREGDYRYPRPFPLGPPYPRSLDTIFPSYLVPVVFVA